MQLKQSTLKQRGFAHDQLQRGTGHFIVILQQFRRDRRLQTCHQG